VGGQQARQPVRLAVQLREGEGGVGGDEGDAVGIGADPRLEQVAQSHVRHRPHRVVPGVEQQLAFAVEQQVDVRDRDVRLPRETAEEGHEPVEVRRQLVVVVAVGVGVQDDPQPVAVRAVVDVDDQVLDQPCADVVHGGRLAGEAQAVVERHDVDRRAEELALVGDQPQVPPQLLVPVPQVRPALPQLGGDLLGQVGERGAGRHPHPQRHDVGDHARHPHRHRAEADHHRQRERDLLGAGHPVQVGGEGGGERLGPHGASLARDGLERGDRVVELRADADHRSGELSGATRENHRRGPVGGPVHPVLAGGRVLRGVHIGLVLDHHALQ
jgi:hypothetical protein